MKMKVDLIDEVVQNARRDRIRLEKVADALLTVSDDTEEAPAEGEQKIAQAAASAAVSEELSKVTDSLTRINQQLVELIKHQRRLQSDDEKKLDSDEKEDVYKRLESNHDGSVFQ